jgi:ribosomal protein S6
MRYYELTYLISPEVEKTKLKEIQEKILLAIRKYGGILDEENPALKRTLAYEIKKKKEAFLVSLTFFLNSEKLDDFKKEIEKEKEILRYLLFKKKAPKEKRIKVKKIEKPKKVELEKIEEKLEEILGEKL